MRGNSRTTTITLILSIFLMLAVHSPICHSASEGENIIPSPFAGGNFGGGNGTIWAPYIIEDVDDLQNMSANLSAYYILDGDIDATITSTWNGGEGFNPVGDEITPFTGSLDGQNHTIFGLYINRTTNCVGLFGYMGDGSNVKGLSLNGLEINGTADYVGGFAGDILRGSITNCNSTGNVRGSNYIGGIVGAISFGTISNCSSTVTIRGNHLLGGIVGYFHLSCTASNCTSTGNVSGCDWIGGFVGWNNGNIIKNCTSTGNVSGERFVGAFLGSNSDIAETMRCYSTGNANGTQYVGGFAGLNYGIITNCYSKGNASANGIAEYVGGFAGRNYDASITNCYSTGNVSGTQYVGGFAGNNTGTGTIVDCFWDTETSGQTTSAGGTGKTTAEMMQQATFTNWDFMTIWGIFNGHTYPFFQPCDFQSSVELALLEGWNLISTPLIQRDESIDKVLGNITGKWDYIQAYDSINGTWLSNATFKPDQLNDFKQLNHKMAFWINITEPGGCNLTVSGLIPSSTTIQLYAGWNLVGYPTQSTETIANALWGTGADKVEVFDILEPYQIKEVGPTYVMRPGEGYWIHVPADTTWIINW